MILSAMVSIGVRLKIALVLGYNVCLRKKMQDKGFVANFVIRQS